MSAPVIILHRRNRSDMLADLPQDAWIEVDLDLRDGAPCLSHDAALRNAERLEDFLPQALKCGVKGFLFDCKREGVERTVQPLLVKHNITDYFYLNEMEIEADRFHAASRDHRSALRIWQYRGAADIIRYAEETRARGEKYPQWAWIDCWHRELRDNIGKAVVPLVRDEADKLHRAGISLCICSPELYVHDYDKTYKPGELQKIYRGIVQLRRKLTEEGIREDAVCTKFAKLWTQDLNFLEKTSTLTI
jgi:hypothetical protein